MKEKKKKLIFLTSPDFFTFLSGALVSMPIALLFELSDNHQKVTYWAGIGLSSLASYFCFKLSIVLKEVKEEHDLGKKVLGNTLEAWDGAIEPRRSECLQNLIFAIITLIASIFCVCIMQL